MTEQDLIAEYLAKGGTIQKCPPRTYALDAYAPITWRERERISWAAQQHAQKAKAKTAEMVAEIPVGQVAPKPRKATYRKASDAQILDALKRHSTTAEAAASVGLQVKQFRDRANALGANLPARAVKVPTDVIVALIASGMTVGEAAAYLGYQSGNVKKRLRVAGVTVQQIQADGVKSLPKGFAEQWHRPVAQKKPRRVNPRYHIRVPTAEVIRLVSEGLTLPEIGEQYQITVSILQSRIKRLGLTVTELREAHQHRRAA